MTKNQTNNLKLLKFIVHFMAVLLIGGIILLFFLAFQRNQEKKAEEVKNNNCPNKEYRLPERGEIKSVSYDDNVITVTIAQGGEQKILVINMCNYEVKHKLIIKQ